MSPAQLLESNQAWARSTLAADPGFFARLERQQSPQYLWIGCSDSRVPANQITGSRRARSSCTAISPMSSCTPT